MDFNDFRAKLYEYNALHERDELQEGTVDRIEPVFADSWPVGIDPRLHIALRNAGHRRPYKHQAEAISDSIAGNNVVLESPTASGKTLAYTVPMLNELAKNPRSYALMVYPMKALALDQQSQLKELCEPLNIRVGKFDKDTPKAEKDLMKKNPPQIIMTNPENLNMSFLGWREHWDFVLARLKYLILDEIHIYRGYFGSQFALVLRRFFLYLNRLGANPRVFLSTATCANPDEHAKHLTGLPVKCLQATDALRPRRHYLFVDPTLDEAKRNYRELLCTRLERVAVALLASDLRALIFCPSKNFLEEASRRSKKLASRYGLEPDQISEFHARLNASTRRKRQENIKAGEITVVFATSALEVGIDIGGLDGVVLAGFPPNTMSAWQQIGRAGRDWEQDAFVLFFPMQDPIDRLFVKDIDKFLGKELDQLVINPDNLEYIDKHLASLTAEIGGPPCEVDVKILGDEFYRAAKRKSGKPLRGRNKPQARLNLRGGEGILYDLKYGDLELGTITAIEMFRYAYIGAIFVHSGEKYEVHSHEKDAIVLEKYTGSEITEPIFTTKPKINETFNGYRYGNYEILHGSVTVQSIFHGYNVVDERTKKKLEFVEPGGDYGRWYPDLHAVCIYLPDSGNVVHGLGALEHLFRLGTSLVIPSERFDISSWSELDDEPLLFIYENYKGGIGIARKLFEELSPALRGGIQFAIECDCDSGCPNCIVPAKSWSSSKTAIDKQAGVRLADEVLAAFKKGPDHKFESGQMVPL